MGDVQSARIPFGNLQASGAEELAGGSPIAMNVIADSTGTIKRRPGLVLWNTSVIDSTGLCSLYETVDGAVYAVGNGPPARNIYKVTSTSSTNLSHGSGGLDVPGTLRPIVAETGAFLVFAGGGDPEKLPLPGGVPSRLGGGPPQGSHVVNIASRLVMNTVTGFKPQVNYSVPSNDSIGAGNEDWTSSTAGTFTAAGKQQPVVAMVENLNETWLLGPTQLNVYIPDPTVAFALSVSRELGTAAPYSIVKSDANFMWLDHLRRFIMSDGRQETVLSEPIQKTLQDMGTVSDCFGFRVVMGYLDCIVWTFPTERRTFVYQKGASWAEWSGWDGSWQPFPVTAATVLKATRQPLMATSTGYLATLSLDASDDLGTNINAFVITGFQDHDTDAWKSCERIRIALKRSSTTGDSAPYMLLSWRDGLGEWGAPIQVSLDADPVVQIDGLGVYRRRQWKMDFREASDLSLVSATEEFRVLAG